MGARTCKDFIQSKEFLCEFLGGPCRTDELSLDVCLATNFEFRGRKPSGISGSLVSMLSFSHVLLKLLVQLIEVSDKVMCTCRSEIAFQVNGKVQMITLVGKEGCNASSGTEYCCKQTQLMEGVQTNCLVGSCNRLRGTVPKSDWFVRSVHHLRDDIWK